MPVGGVRRLLYWFIGVAAVILLASGSPSKRDHRSLKNAPGGQRAPLKQPPTPKMTRQMMEDAEIEAHNKKKIAEQEAERELKQLYQQSTPIKPIGSHSTILFLGHNSILTPAPAMEVDMEGAVDAHFVSFFQQGLAADGKDVTILQAPLDHRDIPRMLQIFSDEPDLLTSTSSQDVLHHVVLVVGHEFVTEMDVSESTMTDIMQERRTLLEQVVAHFKQRAETQVVLVGLFVHGEDIDQASHPHRHAFEECTSMLEQVAKIFEIAFVDLTSAVDTFQRKLNVEQLPHSFLTVDGQHLSVAGHAFVATHLLRTFHQSSVPVSISGHVARLIAEKQEQQQLRRTVDHQLEALIAEGISIATHPFHDDGSADKGSTLPSEAVKAEDPVDHHHQQVEHTNTQDADNVLGVFSLDATQTTEIGEGETVFEL